MRGTPGWFEMQGIPFFLGRDFLPEEGIPGRDHAVILTYKLWNRLGANRNIIGQPLRVDGEPYTVVGVLSPGLGDRFTFELAAPLAFRPEQINHDYHWLLTMGRLKDGVTRQQAQADMDAVTSHIAAAYPTSNKGWGASVEPLKNDFLPRQRVQNLWLLLGAVGFVLMIACVNIANLAAGQGGIAAERDCSSQLGGSEPQADFCSVSYREPGACPGRRRAGRGSGFWVAEGDSQHFARGNIALRSELSTGHSCVSGSGGRDDLRRSFVWLRACVVCVAGGSGRIVERWRTFGHGRGQPQTATWADHGRIRVGVIASHKLRRGLITGEFALALSLLAGAGLAIHSFWNLTRVDLGVRTDHVLTFGLRQAQGRLSSPEQMNVHNQQMLSALRSVPGVSLSRARSLGCRCAERAMACRLRWWVVRRMSIRRNGRVPVSNRFRRTTTRPSAYKCSRGARLPTRTRHRVCGLRW